MKTVEHIFVKFNYLYGRVWTSAQCGEKATAALKQTWLEIIETMTIEDIKQSMIYLQSSWNNLHVDFSPNPLQFQRLPKKIKEKNIPTIDECYNAAIKCDWNFHSIVYPAAKACDIYWLRKQASTHEGRKRFSSHYDSQKEKYLRDEALLCPQNNCKNLMRPKEDKTKIIGSIQIHALELMGIFKKLKKQPAVYQKYLQANNWRERQAVFSKFHNTMGRKA